MIYYGLEVSARNLPLYFILRKTPHGGLSAAIRLDLKIRRDRRVEWMLVSTAPLSVLSFVTLLSK